VYEVVPSDSCTYSGSGDWEVVCGDNCSITTEVDLDGNDLIVLGEGIFNVTGNLTNFNDIKITGNSTTEQCTMLCTDGCVIY